MKNKEVLQALNNVTECGIEMGGEEGKKDYDIVLDYIRKLEEEKSVANNEFDFLPN